VTTEHDIRRAAALILAGDLVAVPTETVYGLAADATNDRAVARIFEAKGRPSFNPLIVHVADIAMARHYVEMAPLAETLARAFWPGPLTLVLPRKAGSAISMLASAGLDTLAVRAPDSKIAQTLIQKCGRPLAAPSANRSGSISPTTAEHVRESLGDRAALILDGGPSRVGVESTIVKVDSDALVLLRPGGIAREEIELVAERKLDLPRSSAVEAPGMMASHYAPRAALRLNATAPREGEAFLAFGPDDHFPNMLNLSRTGDIVEAAANLFAHLRSLDALCMRENLVCIAAAPVPAMGLGEAINDRLARAAAPRQSARTPI
jgi:L-threonylcarbamoyladenylate synthase